MQLEQEKEGWQLFLELCCKIHSPEKMEKVFDLFFTIEEQELLASRCLIIRALLEKKSSQREIAENLGVSISQITRGSNALKIIDDDIRKVLKFRSSGGG